MIPRLEHIGDATLMLGDCCDILQSVGRCSHLISDPPYESEAHTMGRRVNRGKSRGGDADVVSEEILSFPAIDPETREYVARWAAENVDGWALTFCQAEAISAWRDAFECAGAKYKRSMIWVKPDGMPQYNGQMPGMGYESIAAAWCGAGHSKWNGGGRHGIFTHCKNSGGKHLHETQKPIPLMLELIDLFTDPGDLVIDPFMGSATTGVAALRRCRRFVGIEKSERYFDIACERIAAANRQPNLFAPKTKSIQEKMAI